MVKISPVLLVYPYLFACLVACGGAAVNGTVSVSTETDTAFVIAFDGDQLTSCGDAPAICIDNGRTEAVEITKLSIRAARTGDDYSVGIPDTAFTVAQDNLPINVAAGSSNCIDVSICSPWAFWKNRDGSNVRLQIGVTGKMIQTATALTETQRTSAEIEGEIRR